MELGGRHLAALCREIVTLALRSRDQQRQLDEHAERLGMLEDEVTTSREPPPLQIAHPPEPRRSAAVESLTRSFEARLAPSDEEEDR
jgi:hypothetical protein